MFIVRRYFSNDCHGEMPAGSYTPCYAEGGDFRKTLNGEGEIRTPGTFRFIRFQVGRNRPLCHLSRKSAVFKPTDHTIAYHLGRWDYQG